MYYVKDGETVVGMKKSEFVKFLTDSIRHNEIGNVKDYGKERELPAIALEISNDEPTAFVPEFVTALVNVIGTKKEKQDS